MQTLSAQNLTLNYCYAPPPEGAPTVVLINSLGTDYRIWDQVIAQLSGDFGILSYDKRGHGLSDIGDAPYGLKDHVDDLAALMSGLSIDRAILCGVSVGGLIAQGLYHQTPNKVRGLILSNTADKIGEASAWDARIDAIKADGIASIAPTIMRNWFSAGFHQSAPDLVTLYCNMLERCPQEGYLGTCAALRDADLRDQTANIAVPTLCLAGSEDLATPPALVGAMAAKIKDADFHLFEGVGHIPSIEVPHEMASKIKQFSDKIEGQRP